jgi:hypothetical protein
LRFFDHIFSSLSGRGPQACVRPRRFGVWADLSGGLAPERSEDPQAAYWDVESVPNPGKEEFKIKIIFVIPEYYASLKLMFIV